MKMPVKLWQSCFCNGSVKPKKRLTQGSYRHGLTTLNGIDFFPEDFLNIKFKYNKKLGDDELQQIVDDDLAENDFI